MLWRRFGDATARRHVERAIESDDRDSITRWLDRADSCLRARREYATRNLNAQMIVEQLLL